MIIREEFTTLKSGKKLYRTYSDLKVKIKQHPTGAVYSEAIDVAGAPYTYTETNEPVEATE